MNRKVLIGIGLIAGVAQATAGVAMYLAGVYFAPWSMIVSLLSGEESGRIVNAYIARGAHKCAF